MFELVLSELGPWCLAEQDFCVRFFHLTSSEQPETAKQVSLENILQCSKLFKIVFRMQDWLL